MKQTIRWILISVVACAVGSVVTYRIAHHRGYESGFKSGVDCGIRNGSFTQSLGLLVALQKLRADDVPGATRFMETACFTSAQTFYKDPNPHPEEVSDWGRLQGLDRSPDAETARAVAKELVKYRAAYRTNSADWDDMERKLEIQLAKLQ